MKNRKYLMACLVTGLTISMAAGSVGFAAESVDSGIVQQENLNSESEEGKEPESEKESESEPQKESEQESESESERESERESESESEKESEQESESESEAQQDPNVPEGYRGIYEVSDLSMIAEQPEGKYILMNDLDLTSVEQTGIAVFRGILDGKNHKIKGLKTALIQVLEEGTICNLSLTDTAISQNGDTGALANTIGTGKKAAVVIENVSITGSVTGTGNTGALAGLVKGTDIKLERIANSAKISGGGNAGGMIGTLQAVDDQEEASDVSLTVSYNVGEISGAEAGGLVGAVDIPAGNSVRNVKIADCYNAGVLVRGGNIVGKVTAGGGNLGISRCIGIQMYYSEAYGMVGTATPVSGGAQTSVCTLSGCYYYSMNPVYAFADGNYITGTAIALNDLQIKTASYFSGFDFTDIWGIDAAVNCGYPYLRNTALLPVQYVSPTAGTTLLDSKTGGRYTVTVRSQEAAYAGVLNDEITYVTIPAQVEINGITYKVTSIAEKALTGNTKIVNISIPDTVTSIGKYAFKGCTSLVKAAGCKKVTMIYQEAFYGCTSLTTVGGTTNRITLPSAEMIGVRAFRKVSSVRKVYISSPNLTTIKKGAFRECTSVYKFNTVSKKLNTIGKYALYGDSSLKTLIFRSTELTKSKVGTKVFRGIKSTATFKVQANYIEAYRSIFRNSGAGSKIKVKSV